MNLKTQANEKAEKKAQKDAQTAEYDMQAVRIYNDGHKESKAVSDAHHQSRLAQIQGAVQGKGGEKDERTA